jgi:hypothetical protein
MPLGLSVALAMFADTAAVASTTSPPAAPASAAAPQDGCKDAQPHPDSTQITICAQKPQGYRLNPDVMEAKRGVNSAGRPNNPHAVLQDDSCRTIGPMPCMQAGVSLIGAALTAAEMAKRLAEGKEIGSMFITDPHPTEYQLYQMAKARREWQEREAEAEKVKMAATAKAAAASAAKTAASASAKTEAADPKSNAKPADAD